MVTKNQFISFIQHFDGEELKTLKEGKSFSIRVGENCVYFTPKSSGKERSVYFRSRGKKKKDIGLYLELYEQGCRNPIDYSSKNLMDSSCFVALMKEYEKPQNKIFYDGNEKSFGVRETEREALTLARIGQGKFRGNLLQYWKKTCSVSGVGDEKLLWASHIKPWKDSDNKERLNKFNGLLLIPNLDVLFDKGLVTFQDNGKIKISDEISKRNLDKLGVNSSMSLRKIGSEHKKFLAQHREEIFNKR